MCCPNCCCCQLLQYTAITCAQVGEEELEQALTSAVTCCILASAGPQRSRVLANLYKDERCARLPIFPFLEKVYLERILRRQEVGAVGAACCTVSVSVMCLGVSLDITVSCGRTLMLGLCMCHMAAQTLPEGIDAG